MMTRYIAAYDTENLPNCLKACENIVAMHKRHQMPGTFFIVGKVLEGAPDQFRRLLDDPLFEVASHTYSHRMLRDNPFCGKQIDDAGRREEIYRAKEVIDNVFKDRTCVGLRPGCSFVNGLKGDPAALKLLADSGHEYVSSQLWGPEFTLPAPLHQPFSYADDGYPKLMEYPGHGWHENILKSNKVWRVLAFPPQFPGAIPPARITTAEEEFKYNNKFFIDLAVKEKRHFVSMIWHPWSLGAMDPQMTMLDITFRYVKENGLKPMTYEQLHREYVATAGG